MMDTATKLTTQTEEFSPAVRWGWIALLSCAIFGVLTWSYWTTFGWLVTTWQREADYSHGFLVVPAALYCLWLRRDQYSRDWFSYDGLKPCWMGLILFVVCIAMRSLGALWFMDALDGWSILLWCSGAVLMLGGWKLLRWSLPSILFLFFMIPLPYRVEHWVRLPMQSVATQVSAALLQCFGQPAFAEGNTIILGTQRLGVEEACSGLRILMSIAALSFACAVVVKRPLWERIALLVSAVPIAVLANSLRIVVTGLLYQYASSDAARVFSHDLAGWLMIPLAAVFLMAELWFLQRVFSDANSVDMSLVVNRERDEISSVFGQRKLQRGE